MILYLGVIFEAYLKLFSNALYLEAEVAVLRLSASVWRERDENSLFSLLQQTTKMLVPMTITGWYDGFTESEVRLVYTVTR